jgi:hypothetical protein
MVSPLSCWRVIRVDARAPFVRGRLEARRRAQNPCCKREKEEKEKDTKSNDVAYLF